MVLIYEYHMGTYRHINIRNLVLSSVIQYASSIASYYVAARTAVDIRPCRW